MTLGELNYEGYCRAVDNKTWDGRPTPAWSALPERIRNAWEAGAKRVSVRLDVKALEAEVKALEDAVYCRKLDR